MFKIAEHLRMVSRPLREVNRAEQRKV